MQCPKCGQKQETAQEEGRLSPLPECRYCGIIFEKYYQSQEKQQRENTAGVERTDADDQDPLPKKIGELLIHSPDKVTAGPLAGRAIILIILIIWGTVFIAAPIKSNYAGKSFLHLVNLPFHEAGHLVFRPFGNFIASLGGTLGQLLMPLICLGVLLIQTRDTFGAAVSFWWFGQNFIDIAPYINDARDLSLPLLGGNYGHSSPYGFHDWQYILSESGLLEYDHFLAKSSLILGALIMVTACAWAGFLLYRQYKHLSPKTGNM